MGNKIYPIAYKLAPGQVQTLHYLGFPSVWKTVLLEIAQKNNPKFKDEYGLPTNALKKLVESWMEGIIALAPLKKYSDDEHWLTSCYPYSERDIKVLCGIIRVWVMATYAVSPKASPLVKKMAHEFCEMVSPENLETGQSEAEICLTLEDGTVTEEAYQAIPLLATNRLLGKEIVLNGQMLHFCHAGRNQLISQPISGGKDQHQYSFVFDFSVQTTPPKREALLLCQMTIRRWIPGSFSQERTPYISESVNAHIKVSENKYCQVPISYNSQLKQPDWNRQDKECYNIWGYKPLPLAADVLRAPLGYTSQVLLPYKNGMHGFIASKIGAGVPVVDKAALYQKIGNFLSDITGEQPEGQRVRSSKQKIEAVASPQAYGDTEMFRSWVHKCADTNHIVFELYGLWKDPAQRLLLEQIEEKIFLDFGENMPDSCLKIEILYKETGSLADAMVDDKKATQIQRCSEILQELGKADTVTGCIFALPGPEHYSQGDPKRVLRNAFARSGRVVQFFNPSDEDNRHKVENAVYDLYRQLGVVVLPNVQKSQPFYANIPCVGMHVCTQVHGISNKARFLPVYVTVDILNGKTRVQCDAFSDREVSYREACLEMAQLFWKSDLEQRCVDASRSPAKQKLIELKNRFNEPENAVLLIVQSDGNTRALWSGISDKEIGGYGAEKNYSPIQINAGVAKNPISLALQNTGVRIVRIRSNQEVPDYYTVLSAKSSDEHLQYASAAGIFRYGSVFWGILPKPNDRQYNDSLKKSKSSDPKQRFAEKDMIELYPLQLQLGDHVDEWIFYTNALRHIPIQYSQSTVLPLPLHLAKGLEEYLFNI